MDYLQIKELYHSALEKNELYHHGIKGQKWGIRRFQNEDGSLTEEGKDRYYNAISGNNYHKKEKLEKELLSTNKPFKEKIDKIKEVNKQLDDNVKNLKSLDETLWSLSMYDYIDDYENDINYEAVLREYRKDLKQIYLNAINNKNTLDALNREKALNEEKGNLYIEAIKMIVSQKKINDIPDSKTYGSIFVSDIINKERIKNKIKSDYTFSDFAKGPVPKEYLDRIDEWYEIQFMD